LAFTKGLWGQLGERKRKKNKNKNKNCGVRCFAVFALVFLVVLLFASISARCRRSGRTGAHRACRKTQLGLFSASWIPSSIRVVRPGRRNAKQTKAR